MRVECHIDPACDKPHAVLHIDQMTPLIAEVISLLEREDAASAALIAVKDGKTYFLEPEQLELVRTEGREIVCYDDQKNRYVLGRPLYELEQTLDLYFARISKSAIVNLRRISHVKAGLNGTMELVTKTGLKDYISRSFRKSFKERLGLR